MAAPLPSDEQRRLQALRQLEVLDTSPEPELDALVEAAALTCGVPISLLSLVDADRQWFKANLGLPGVTETPRDLAFCAHAILHDGLFEVADTTLDSRFADNALVTGEPGIRFYAGAPLCLQDGTRAGTLCVIDRQPRRLDATQRRVLENLARAATQALEGRRALRSERALHQRMAAAAAALVDSEARFRALSEASPLGVFEADLAGAITYTNARWQAIHGQTPTQGLGQGWTDVLHPEDRDAVLEAWTAQARTGRELDLEYRIVSPDGQVRSVRSRASAILDDQGRRSGCVGSVEDITEARAVREHLLAEQQRMASIIDGIGAGTWEWNVQTGETRFSEHWAGMLGFSLAELAPVSAQTWLQAAHPEDLQRAEVLLARHFAGETERYGCEVRMRHRDGHWVWVLARGRVLTWTPQGRPEWMFGTHLDITEHKRQHEALRRSEVLMDRAGEVAGVGGWELDLVTGSLMWTPQTRSIYGVAPDFTPSLEGAFAFYTPEARPLIQSAVSRAMATGEGWDLELTCLRADGQPIWVRAVGHAEFENGQAVRLLGALQDISQRKALHAELADQHELLRVTLQSIGDAVITTDRHGRVTWLNPVAERMTGWPNGDAQGCPIEQVFHIVHEQTLAPAENPVTVCLATGQLTGLASHTVLRSRHGQEFGIEDSASPIRSEAGDLLGAVLVFHDVTEQRRLSGEMTYRATHDALTGLVNRAEFETRLRRLLAKSQEDGSEHALLYLDLDQFKLVNDACGHSVGDQLLQQVSRLLAETVRARDTLARLGGDEFAVLLEHCSAQQAQRVAQQICDRMEDFRFVHDQRRFRIGASIGLVPMDRRWSTPAAVMRAADTSCYAAKEAGRNRVHAWFDTDQAMQARHGEMQWASRIEQALDEDRFELHAQRIVPVTEAETGLHAEVLLRLREGNGALVLPGAFLPAAERFHLATRIDRWVLKAVVAQLQRAGDHACDATLSVNLSGQSIGDRAFHQQALELLRGAGRQVCQRLYLEITETVAVTNMGDAARFIDQVRTLGVRVALDDFGAGASSFGYLKSLAIDCIKIDGQFIRDLVTDPLDEAAVRCFADVAKVLAVRTVAEFVDRPEVLEKVRQLGIDFAQGYLLHRPEPLRALLDGVAQAG